MTSVTVNGRRYDVIDVITPSGEKHKFFFDITEAAISPGAGTVPVTSLSA